jgi:hypothetical protein
LRHAPKLCVLKCDHGAGADSGSFNTDISPRFALKTKLNRYADIHAVMVATKELEATLNKAAKLWPVNFEPQQPSSSQGGWITGSEVYDGLKLERIYELMGVVDGRIPGLAREVHKSRSPYDGHGWDLWGDGGKVKFDVKHHQAVGILIMLDNFFGMNQHKECRPTLLFDDVGMGKTVMYVGYVAMIMANREHKKAHGVFLGKFRESGCSNLNERLKILWEQAIAFILWQTKQETFHNGPSYTCVKEPCSCT